MRLGLLADIHEAVGPLGRAVQELKALGVDSFVILGDVLDCGERVEETVSILAPLAGVGVWGNHDFGLCGEVPPAIRGRFSEAVLDYFSGLRPTVELAGCRFQHIDPHLDPGSFEDLWRFTTLEERIKGIGQRAEARVFVGHHHRWEVVTPEREIEWEEGRVMRFESGQRYLTTVNAVADGWFAVLDTERDELRPLRVT